MNKESDSEGSGLLGAQPHSHTMHSSPAILRKQKRNEKGVWEKKLCLGCHVFHTVTHTLCHSESLVERFFPDLLGVVLMREGGILPGPSCPPHCPSRNQCRMSGETQKSRNPEPPPRHPQKSGKDTPAARGWPGKACWDC